MKIQIKDGMFETESGKHWICYTCMDIVMELAKTGFRWSQKPVDRAVSPLFNYRRKKDTRQVWCMRGSETTTRARLCVRRLASGRAFLDAGE